MSKPETRVAGIVLAAGAGTRFGGAKALARDPDGTPWLPRAVRALLAGGCSPVLVALGSEGPAAERLLTSTFLADVDAPGSPVRVVRVESWRDGISASIRAGLLEAGRLEPLPDAVAIVTVDVPSLSAAMVRRLTADAGSASDGEPTHALRQASFSGRPGHPVAVGRAHWERLAEAIHGDTGARPYLVANGVSIVDCSDLGSGLDVDQPGAATG